ncbi:MULTISPECIES: M48 family metallopeptidase [unclassified Novosphingobium]|uniref:M48 family metallopeptidase n=1 Tax=unclassified Novosphingobium TaxID=2644732 RepID=UPI0014944041|nr:MULTISPECIES: M48 family metallopeptidase [unclassified Novosphingobium]MBB3359953.1 hypothetical protein [Novosphingobium sp. BK256]MBB3376312.1 hypothetical protein [Novosphingobium sp. BK280]MBB3380807.1 hypothetical protein [Novosphingobium sp. BK258]MBB3422377.1 hypothetical protein [Novosphingobium sp. BK267]MBB3451158.1 hypothetical protein [Novosphingobium sp. BK352]
MIIADIAGRLLKPDTLLVAVGCVLACAASQALAAGAGLLEPAAMPEPPPCITAKPAGSPALRVATIGYQLAVANKADCPSHAMLSGLLLHDRAAYSEKTRRTLTGLGNGFGILGVVAGSPADAAGLTAGDEIIGLDGAPLTEWRTDLESAGATYARVEAFTATLSKTLSHGPAHLRIVHAGQERDVILAQQPGCDVSFALLPGRKPDAWTDGRYLAVTAGLTDLVGDDALAFAMAHELAHVALGHAKEAERPLAAFGIGAGHVRQEESQADLLGLRFSQAAGYSLSGGAMLFNALAKSGSLRWGLTHPSNNARITALTQEAAHLAQQPSSLPKSTICTD